MRKTKLAQERELQDWNYLVEAMAYVLPLVLAWVPLQKFPHRLIRFSKKWKCFLQNENGLKISKEGNHPCINVILICYASL